MDKIYVIAEIGINHNGSIETAKELIEIAKNIGCDAVKFQKRTIDVVFTEEQLNKSREGPFGDTYGDAKRGLEFEKEEYDQIDEFCFQLEIDWFASAWDEASVEFLLRYDVPYLKISSASITDKDLLQYCAMSGTPLLISTGMCDLPAIRKAVSAVYDVNGEIACLFHCTSSYPSKIEELNLLGIVTLMSEFPGIPIGYSGHETIVPTAAMVAALGIKFIERHFTLDRSMWGTDQSSSLEPNGMKKVVDSIRVWERAKGDGVITIYDSEFPLMDKHRRKNTL